VTRPFLLQLLLEIVETPVAGLTRIISQRRIIEFLNAEFSSALAFGHFGPYPPDTRPTHLLIVHFLLPEQKPPLQLLARPALRTRPLVFFRLEKFRPLPKSSDKAITGQINAISWRAPPRQLVQKRQRRSPGRFIHQTSITRLTE
jgi:hypothetical protein